MTKCAVSRSLVDFGSLRTKTRRRLCSKNRVQLNMHLRQRRKRKHAPECIPGAHWSCRNETACCTSLWTRSAPVHRRTDWFLTDPRQSNKAIRATCCICQPHTGQHKTWLHYSLWSVWGCVFFWRCTSSSNLRMWSSLILPSQRATAARLVNHTHGIQYLL